MASMTNITRLVTTPMLKSACWCLTPLSILLISVASHCQKDKVVELNVIAGRNVSLPIPKRFSRDILCTWVIAAPEGLYVKLTIDKLKPKIDRQSSSLCIRDGRNSSSHLLNKPCDLGVKCTAVFSSGRYLWVQFSSKKASYDASGFKAVYTAVKCKRHHFLACLCPEDSANVILSKNCGPLSSYNCRSRHHKHWKRICCYMKNKGELRFDSFNPSDSKDCADEYLEIYHVRCFGSNRPASTVTVNGPDTRNEPRSNGMEHIGSIPRYKPATVVGSCRKDKIVELNETSGKIFSPMYPRDFPRGTACTWLITAPEGLHVRLKLKKLELDGGCLSALYIRNGKDSSSPLLQKYCGQEPDKASSVFSSDRYLWVNFSSKNTVKGDYYAPGFCAEYEVVQQLPAPFSCTFRDGPLTLYNASGNLASYIYPLPYDESITCIWKFMMSSEYEIELSFDSFNLSYSKDCTDDYVEIRRVKYCGSNAPPTVTLDRSSMSVTFRSSGKVPYPGFKASYTSKRTSASVRKSVALCLGFLLVLSIATFFAGNAWSQKRKIKRRQGMHREQNALKFRMNQEVQCSPSESLTGYSKVAGVKLKRSTLL